MAREYNMVKRREKVDATRRRIAKATYELHSTIGPAFTTVALVSERSGLPRQTVYRNFASNLDLFRGCIAFGLELNPLPDPGSWEAIADPGKRLDVGLTELYGWFEATEPVMTNAFRDYGAVKESAEALQPVGEIFQRMYMTLTKGWDGPATAAILSLAVDFATWKKLHGEQGMASEGIVELWAELIRCRQAG